MNRPNKEDFHQDRTGQKLMNGPYNQTAYARSLEKYIDYLESKNDSVLSSIIDSYAKHGVIIQIEPGGYHSGVLEKLEWRSIVMYRKNNKWLGRYNEEHATFSSAWEQAKKDAEDIKRNYP